MSGPVHATAVAVTTPAGWRAALLRGPSGSGKSDLALRLVAAGARLVGDDYVHVFASGGALFAAPARTIAGRIEMRGLAVVDRPRLTTARVVLACDLQGGPTERLPDRRTVTIDGVGVACLDVDPRPVAACILVAEAIRRLSPGAAFA